MSDARYHPLYPTLSKACRNSELGTADSNRVPRNGRTRVARYPLEPQLCIIDAGRWPSMIFARVSDTGVYRETDPAMLGMQQNSPMGSLPVLRRYGAPKLGRVPASS